VKDAETRKVREAERREADRSNPFAVSMKRWRMPEAMCWNSVHVRPVKMNCPTQLPANPQKVSYASGPVASDVRYHVNITVPAK